MLFDCGPVVNPDTLEGQMSGAITMGWSAALQEKVEFADGGVKSANYSDYHLLRMSDAPEVGSTHDGKRCHHWWWRRTFFASHSPGGS